MAKKKKTPPTTEAVGHILCRRDNILCMVCGEVEPVGPGDGTPLSSLLAGYEAARQRHPARKHERHVR